MRIIWKTNIPLPKAADAFGFSKSYGGGWLVGLSEDLRCQPEIELSICFLQNGISGIQEKTVDNITYIAVPQKILNPCIYNADLEGYFKAIADKIKPDVIHVFGTEFPHTLSMVKACSADYNMVISIQRLVSICAKHYYAGLPYSVLKKKTFRDWIRGGFIQNRRNFEKRGVFEVKALQKVRHIIGRTTWNRACIKQINPEATYYHCNETLRSEFYKHQ